MRDDLITMRSTNALDSDDTKEAHPSEDASRDLANDDWDEEEVGEDEHEPARASDLYLDTVSSSVYHSRL